MKVQKKITYISDDGIEFDTAEECCKHELVAIIVHSDVPMATAKLLLEKREAVRAIFTAFEQSHAMKGISRS